MMSHPALSRHQECFLTHYMKWVWHPCIRWLVLTIQGSQWDWQHIPGNPNLIDRSELIRVFSFKVICGILHGWHLIFVEPKRFLCSFGIYLTNFSVWYIRINISQMKDLNLSWNQTKRKMMCTDDNRPTDKRLSSGISKRRPPMKSTLRSTQFMLLSHFKTWKCPCTFYYKETLEE